RSPSLRNVALRAPYMHNGRFATLEEVVDFYDRGGDVNAPNKDPNIRPLRLNAQEKADLAAFLRRPLTDPRLAVAAAPFDAPALFAGSPLSAVVIDRGRGGSGGRIPEIVAVEPAFTGNPNFTVAVFNALGGARARLALDTQVPPDGALPVAPYF